MDDDWLRQQEIQRQQQEEIQRQQQEEIQRQQQQEIQRQQRQDDLARVQQQRDDLARQQAQEDSTRQQQQQDELIHKQQDDLLRQLQAQDDLLRQQQQQDELIRQQQQYDAVRNEQRPDDLRNQQQQNGQHQQDDLARVQSVEDQARVQQQQDDLARVQSVEDQARVQQQDATESQPEYGPGSYVHTEPQPVDELVRFNKTQRGGLEDDDWRHVLEDEHVEPLKFDPMPIEDGNVHKEQEDQPEPGAPVIGESMINPQHSSGLKVDMAMQEHKDMREYRLGTGKDAQSAHMVPTSAVENFESYSRSKALTALLPPEVHKEFDDYWKDWARQRVATAKTEDDYKVSVEEFLKVLDEAAQSVFALHGRTADTMHWVFEQEFYQTLGLEPSTKVRVPYSPKSE